MSHSASLEIQDVVAPGTREAKALQALRKGIHRILGEHVEGIYLYGSRARGEARPDSDIDVLVVVRGDWDYGDLIRRTSLLTAAISLQYDVVISRAFVSAERFATEQSPFLLNVHREGVPV